MFEDYTDKKNWRKRVMEPLDGVKARWSAPCEACSGSSKIRAVPAPTTPTFTFGEQAALRNRDKGRGKRIMWTSVQTYKITKQGLLTSTPRERQKLPVERLWWSSQSSYLPNKRTYKDKSNWLQKPWIKSTS